MLCSIVHCCVADFDQLGVLHSDSDGRAGAASGVRGATRLRAPTSQGQVLELCILQVHLRVRRDQRAVHGRGGDVVCMVHRARLTAPARSALQGPL